MLHFDDIRPGEAMQSTTFSIDQDEKVEFARRWDAVPIHIDPDAAAAVIGWRHRIRDVRPRHEVPAPSRVTRSRRHPWLGGL
jgi:acyl dehydratase